VIRRIAADDPRWAAYVAAHPAATAYHLPGWIPVLRRAYRFGDASLALERADGTLAGVLPLMARRGRLTGGRLRSLPVVGSGGPLAGSVEDEASLVAAAAELGQAEGLVTWIRSRTPGLDALAPAVRSTATPPSWVLAVPDDPAGWLRARPARLRRGIRRAAKDGVTVEPATSEDELRAFYALYVETMRRHRFAPRAWAQLAGAREHLGDAFVLLLARRAGRVIAGGVFHVVGTSVELLYNASDPAALDHRPNHALYAHVVEDAAARGLRAFDFGVAWPGSSLAEFKAQWGAVETPEYLYTDGPGPAPVPAGEALPAAPAGDPGVKDRLVDAAWDRVPPRLLATGSAFALRNL
jgi:CelD/BcsL family acetyltransferase involved in cellulose biosynthesis